VLGLVTTTEATEEDEEEGGEDEKDDAAAAPCPPVPPRPVVDTLSPCPLDEDGGGRSGLRLWSRPRAVDPEIVKIPR
jgi:hypothetical protein